MDYASRLANLNLSSLEYRRVYFDLTMCYKIVNKLLDIDAAEMFTVSSNVHSTQGNSYRLQSITIPRHDFRLYFFTSRDVPIWNSLPQHVVSAKNIITFMSHLRQSIAEHHNFCHDPLKAFSFFSNLIGLIEISYYAQFHFRIHFG